MGASLGRSARANGHRVIWARDGRSAATQARAAAAQLLPVADLAALVVQSDVIFSVCPPHGAEELAQQVIDAGYRGLFVDANAIRPERARRIGVAMEAAGARFVDGGIIGNPPNAPGQTRLYLSGLDAAEVAAMLQGSWHEPIVVGGQPGAASALKLAYAAWNKGRIALRLAVVALARAEGVEDAFAAEWARSQPRLMAQTREDAARVAGKAWRWTGEMQEIAATFESAGLPGQFHVAAEQVYESLADFKDAAAPDLGAVVDALLAHE